jgi:hypothetical protein
MFTKLLTYVCVGAVAKLLLPREHSAGPTPIGRAIAMLYLLFAPAADGPV